jgi:hypothetical protein
MKKTLQNILKIIVKKECERISIYCTRLFKWFLIILLSKVILNFCVNISRKYGSLDLSHYDEMSVNIIQL